MVEANNNRKEFEAKLSSYVKNVRMELADRWEFWPKNFENINQFEVIGGLLARQVSLATQMALCPPIWNPHIAPILLRTMVDTYIATAWILKKPTKRSKEYIKYGLGQEKLYIEHLKNRDIDDESIDDIKEVIKVLEDWIDYQRFTFLVDVDLGTFSGKNTRKMAEESDSIDIYRYSYQPFSAATHSMWNHVAKYNLTHCQNPLHKYHRIPEDSELLPDSDYLYRATKYVQKSFLLFDNFTNYRPSKDSSFKILWD